MMLTRTSRFARLLFAAALIATLIWSALPALVARAVTINVNTTNDELNNDGDCSLREAIRAANLDQAVSGCPAGNGTDTIVLPAGTYLLTIAGTDEDEALSGDLDITDDLTLRGASRNNTTIDGNGIDRVLQVLASNVTISRVTITGGNSPAGIAGGIHVFGTGSLTINNSRVTGNLSGGGVVAQYADALTITDTRIDNNTSDSGGGIGTGGADTIIINSVINGNTATQSGGGIYAAGAVTMINSTISGNDAGQDGGGVFGAFAAEIHLRNVTLANNTADLDGNGIGDGGGIYLIAGAGDAFIASNTIIANNGGLSYDDCYSDDSISATHFSFNLLEDTVGCYPLTGTGGNNINNQDPQLDPLAFNGGSILTHALQSNSPAIDSGGPLQCRDDDGALLITDQRGYARPIDGDGDGLAVCDMGAYEYDSPGTPTPTNTATRTNTPLPTKTNTPTRTPTHTSTSSSSPTHTRTPTASLTPSKTNTGTAGPSPTHTRTPTASVTPSKTNTATAGPSPTATPTGSLAATLTATVSSAILDHWIYLPIISK